MLAALLDINVLIALAWPNHEHHARAHRWFAANASGGWVTCPLTQCGFVRISSNIRIIPQAASPADALELLKRMTAHPNHLRWDDDIAIDDVNVPWQRIQGHRQITDAYLLALCRKHGGRLATMDEGLLSLARTESERQSIEIVPA